MTMTMTLMTTMTDDDDDDMILRLPDSLSNWNLEVFVFEERGKPECPENNLLEQAQRERTHDKLNPHVALTLRFKHRPHLWEASASTIMPPLLPVVNLVCVWYRVRESCHFMPIYEINASVFLSTSKTLTGEDFWTVYPSYRVQACHRSWKKVMKNHGIWRTQKTMNPVPSRQ